MQVFFSQGVAVLFSQAPDLGTLRLFLEREGYTIKAAEDSREWPEMQGACLTVSLGTEKDAVCWVDICEFPWPDDMGSTGTPTMLTSAHAMGAFGPFVNPGALTRAIQAPGYQEAAPASGTHRAFVRLRISHFFPANHDAPHGGPAQAQNVHHAFELGLILRAAASLAAFPEAVAFFNPNSELLLTMQGLNAVLASAWEQKTFPVQAVCRVRGCKVNESWSLVDSIGLEQLGLPDHEFAWATPAPSRQEQIEFMLNLIHYQVDQSARIHDRHTTNGPGEKFWRAEERESSCMMPPRKVLHWRVEGDPPEPEELCARGNAVGEEQAQSNPDTDFANVAAHIQHTLNAWLSQREAVRIRAVAWLRSPEFLTSYYDDAHFPESLKYMLEKELPKKEAQKAIQNVQHLGQQTPALWAQYQELASKGQVWFSTPVMSNPNFAAHPDTLLPCGVIVSTGQTSEAIFKAGLFAPFAYSLYTGEGNEKQYPGTARIMANDEYRLFYREAFPAQETEGEAFLYMSLLLRKDWMPPEEVPFIPLLAHPGAKGAVVQIPWHIASGQQPPKGMTKPGRFADFGALDRKAERMLAEQYSGFGGLIRRCWHIFVLILKILFWIGVIAGAITVFLDKK